MSAAGLPASLTLSAGFPLPTVNTALGAGDTMFAGHTEHYLAVGLSALRCVEWALAGQVPNRILDLPCGWGRVTRMLRARYPSARITVSDLDAAGVAFVSATFGAEAVPSTPDPRDLRLPDGFDLIWVGSLVTHLSEAQSLDLLRSLAAALARDGVLVVTSHGPSIVPGLTTWGYGLQAPEVAALLDEYVDHGFGHHGYGAPRGYGISLADQPWWERATAGLGLTIEGYAARMWDDHQDVVVLRHGTARPCPPDRNRSERETAARYDPVMRDFDAGFYLRTYPDVAEAIDAGRLASPFAHYAQFGRAEGRLPRGPGLPAAG